MRCDAHVHVVAGIESHRQIPGRTFTAREAPLSRLKALGEPFGIDHFVLTQPSFYGTDNSVLLGGLQELGAFGRGVAVVGGNTTVSALQALHVKGVVALRVNLYSPAAQNVGNASDDLPTISKLASQARMHVEVIAPLHAIIEKAGTIRSAPVKTVIDHYGLHGGARPNSAEGRELLSLLGHDHVWIKLSSPYRLDHAPRNVVPDREWLEAIMSVAPERCVWGSDWPHPPEHETHRGPHIEIPYREVSYGALVEAFVETIGDASVAERVMWTNSAELYGFGDSNASH